MSAPQQVSAFNNQIPPRYTIKNITAAYAVTGADYGVILSCTGTTSYALNLSPAASVGVGFNIWVWNQTATTAMAVTITPASETIDGVATLILRQGEGTQIVCDGTNWQTGAKKTMRAYAENVLNTATRPVASSNYSLAIGANSGGGGSVTATGAGAMALGGSYASGTDSFAAAGTNNTSTYGAQGTSSVAIGRLSKVTGSYSVALGGATSTGSTRAIAIGSVSCYASGNGAIAIGSDYTGGGPTASGTSSIAIGDSTIASQTLSVALGYSSTSNIIGKYAYGSGNLAAQGDAQTGTFVLRASTTGSTVVLTTDGSTAGTANQLIAASNQVFAVTGTLIGKQSASANIAAYTITATVVNNAGTLTVPTATLTLVGTDSIGLTTSPTLTADNTNKCMAVTSGAKTATNIRWVCTLQTSELTYA